MERGAIGRHAVRVDDGEQIRALVDLGIVREITGQRRNRLFVYDVYLSILNEGTEPL